MFSLAHISDVHLAPLPQVRPAELRGKRFIGYHSWQYRRRYIHRPEILQVVVTDLLAHRPDHVALTGDLINLSLQAEYRVAAKWLEALGEPEWITFVPGNHDAYVPFPWDTGLGLWSGYMTGDMAIAGAHNVAGLAAPFPFVRQRGNVALIGASSAVPMGWRLAAGRLGMPQIEALRAILRELRNAGCFASC
jgi:3',5'-cyclic AMP phosphodiesterase CpdA